MGASVNHHNPGLQQRASDSRSTLQTREAKRNQRKEKSKERTQKIRRLKLQNLTLILILVVSLVSWFLTWTYFILERETSNERYFVFGKIKQQLEEKTRLLSERESQLEALVKGRIPGLIEFTPNQPVNLDIRYLKSLTLSETGYGGHKGIEYYAFFHNETDIPVEPKVKLYLFDEMGLQLSLTHIAAKKSENGEIRENLRPGERRTYSAKIHWSSQKLPRYFRVDVDGRHHALAALGSDYQGSAEAN